MNRYFFIYFNIKNQFKYGIEFVKHYFLVAATVFVIYY